MYRNDILLAALVLLCCAAVATSQSTTAVSRCFQFTWLGPRYHNGSEFMNATCGDATRLASGVPCQEPLVASYDGTWPDVDYIWTHHSLQASCILADNDVCAKFTYYFNNHVENSTYMCTRAVDTNGAAITSGCYKQVNGSFETSVCFCRSVPGGVPCNGATLNSAFSTFLIISVIALIVKSSVVNICQKTQTGL